MAIVTRRYLYEGPSLDAVRNQTDPGLTVASAALKIAFDATFDDAVTSIAAVDAAMAPSGLVPDPAADTSVPPSFPGGGSSNALIYRPGSGLPGPIVFDAWADLVAELAMLRGSANGSGSYTIVFDDSIVSPAPVPPGVYDMSSVTLSGRPNLPTKAIVPEGVIFQNLRRMISFLEITFTGATPPVSDFAGSPGVQDAFQLSISAKVQCTGTGPFFRNSAAGPATIVLEQGAQIAAGATQVIDAATAASQIFVASIAGRGVLDGDTVKGVVGSVALLLTLESAAQLSESQPAFAGTITPFNLTIARWFASFVFTGTPVSPVDPNQVIQVDSTAGAFVIPLPQAFNLRGVLVIVKDVGGSAATNPVTITPSGGDTIDGAGAYNLDRDRGAVTFCSDGGTNWNVISER